MTDHPSFRSVTDPGAVFDRRKLAAHFPEPLSIVGSLRQTSRSHPKRWEPSGDSPEPPNAPCLSPESFFVMATVQGGFIAFDAAMR